MKGADASLCATHRRPSPLHQQRLARRILRAALRVPSASPSDRYAYRLRVLLTDWTRYRGFRRARAGGRLFGNGGSEISGVAAGGLNIDVGTAGD